MFPRLKQRRGSRGLAASLALAQRVYIINNGHIAHEGPAKEIKVRPEILQRYLGV
jgi:branched-chain amino acid transport system ATP-binding protein